MSRGALGRLKDMTYVLLSGAGGDPWYWHRVVPLLRERGHEVLVPDLPATDEDAGLEAYADTVARAIGDRRGVVLVAQSMAGLYAPLVCERAAVALLVLVAPMIPAPGETGDAWWEASGQQAAERELALREGRDPDAPFDVVEMFLHDLPPDVLEALLAREAPDQAGRPMRDPFPLERWPAVPTRVVAGRHDRLFPLGFLQRLSRERLGTESAVVDSGHLPALVCPEALVERLEAFREEAGGAGGL